MILGADYIYVVNNGLGRFSTNRPAFALSKRGVCIYIDNM